MLEEHGGGSHHGSTSAALTPSPAAQGYLTARGAGQGAKLPRRAPRQHTALQVMGKGFTFLCHPHGLQRDSSQQDSGTGKKELLNGTTSSGVAALPEPPWPPLAQHRD